MTTDHPMGGDGSAASSPHEPAPGTKSGSSPRARRRLLLAGLGIVAAAALLLGATYYLLYVRGYESTDDAFIEGRIIPISAKVAGHVLRVHVEDNQDVRAGDLLIEIDPRDYDARVRAARANLQAAVARRKGSQETLGVTRATSTGALEQAQSAVQSARAQAAMARERLTQAQAAIATADATAQQARAEMAAAEAAAQLARSDAGRYRQLFDERGVSRQDLDRALAAAETADANLEAKRRAVAAADARVADARAAEQAAGQGLRQADSQIQEALGRLTAAKAAPAQVSVSQAQLETSEAEIEQMRAALALAELELGYTRVTAASDGRVTKKSVEAGGYVQVGQALLALVPRSYWVVANFKETQLTRIRPGQSVTLHLDAYPDHTFTGRVDSIQAGAGARFSLLPPENATGNFVKVVQRVPVKIVFDEAPDPRYPLGPGMSVVPTVKVR